MVLRAPATTLSPAPADERTLVEAAQRDPSGFAELYELHFDRVYLFIVRRVGDRDIAEDLTSDVFHKALSNLKKFEWRGAPFGAWLLRIAANAITDRGKRSNRELLVEDPPELGVVSDFDELEDGARLFRLVNQLPEDQRNVVVLRFAEEKSIREIATDMNRSEGSIKQLQLRGLRNLKAALEGGSSRQPKRVHRTKKTQTISGGKNG